MSVFGFPGFHETLVDVGAPKRPLEEDEEFQTLMRQRTNYRPEGYRPPDTLNRELFEAIERGNVLEEHAGRLIADHNALDAEHERLRHAHRFLQMKHEYVGIRRVPEATWVYEAFLNSIVNNNADDANVFLNIQDPPLRNDLLNHEWSHDEINAIWPEDEFFWDEDYSLWTPVSLAACFGSQAVLDTLIAAGAEVRVGEDFALRAAAGLGYDETVARLIAAGADVHAKTDEALREAAYFGHDAVVAILIDAGANVHAKKDLALVWAAENDRQAVVTLLIAAGANVHARRDGALRLAARTVW